MLGVDVFLVLSLLACFFDFPIFIQYVYHISAFVGLGQLWINYVFALGEETRFLICFVYLLIGLANIIFVNGYIGFRDGKTLLTTSLLCCVTIPLYQPAFLAVSYYVNKVPISLPKIIAAILVVDAIILATSLILSVFRPKSQGLSTHKKKEMG